MARVARKSDSSPSPAAPIPPAPACIRLFNVRQNNLKGFDLELALGKLIVITGLSGSGKSSLAFETLYAEGQRRYIETFTPYARQFFDRMDKPAVDRIENIPPAIAIEQRNAVRTTRSTIGTMTEVCDYLKVLWPHLATLHCRRCDRPVRREPPQVVWEAVRNDQGPISNTQTGAARDILVTFDLPLSDKLTVAEQLALLSKQGFQRILLDGAVVRVDEAHSALRTPHSALTVIADRVKLVAENRSRFVEACEQAYHFGRGKLTVRGAAADGAWSTVLGHFSAGFHCAACDLDYREPTPALFSFNNPVGACPTCKGFGRIITIDPDLALPDRSKTLAEGVVKPWQTETGKQCQDDLVRAAKKRGVSMHVPFRELSAEHQRWVTDGDDGYIPDDPDHSWPKLWYGVKGYFRWLESKAYKMHVRVLLSRYRSYKSCPACDGLRFNADSLAFRLRNAECGTRNEGSANPSIGHSSLVIGNSLTLAAFYALPIRDALALIDRLAASPEFRTPQSAFRNPLAVALNEVRTRLGFLAEVGLGYLTLDRATRTLSGGETERVNLTTCLGTRLTNTLFVLDEPSVGLHPHDTDRLVQILHRLRDAGNTVVVVEHEASVMRAADQIVDLGPGHGETGGQIAFQGPPAALARATGSLTADYLTGRKRIEVPTRRPINLGQAASLPDGFGKRPSTPQHAEAAFAADTITPYRTAHPPGRLAACPTLRLTHAAANNLRDVAVEIPLGRFVCVSGVSGSGKTTLIREVLLPLLQAKLADSGEATALEDEVDGESREAATAALSAATLTGWEALGHVVLVDQSPLGRTPRSNPGVYIGAFDDIRDFFAASEVAKERGLDASAFSFNSAKGQCERCRGAGFEKIEMQFLSDVFIRCPACQGRRYREHILDVKVTAGAGWRVISDSVISRSVSKGAADTSLTDSLNTAPLIASPSWSIADLLDATVEDAVSFLEAFGRTHRPAQRAATKLKLLVEVGLGYLRVGQPINTLSGGESQRLKLVSHLAESAAAETKLVIPEPVAKRLGKATLERLGRSNPQSAVRNPQSPKPTLFLFDEPTTGLHFDDVRVLLAVFQRLVNAGHTVLVIEHNLDVIKSADWVIDLGPDAGDEGGRVVASGTPEDVALCPESHTGRFLRELGIRA
jgi:excinuclease ABC subunit A